MLNPKTIDSLKQLAKQIRILTIQEIANLGKGHIGGSMSIIEILTYLYFYEMNIDTKLPSHCDMTKTPGVDFTTGSLGQGASAAAGIALGQKMLGEDSYTYLIIGDGESQEGQIWEMAGFSSTQKLGNLIAFTDFNKMQLDGYTRDIMSMDNIDTRWLGFGWHVQRIDGHDFDSITIAVENAKSVKDRPSMIICDTKKSKGYYFGENVLANHSMSISDENCRLAVEKLLGGLV